MSEVLSARPATWRTLAAYTGLLSVVGAGVTYGVHKIQTDPSQIFAYYGCLTGTPWDINHGSPLVEQDVDGHHLVSAVERYPNHYQPGILNFETTNTGFFSISMQAADPETAQWVAENCNDVPNGVFQHSIADSIEGSK